MYNRTLVDSRHKERVAVRVRRSWFEISEQGTGLYSYRTHKSFLVAIIILRMGMCACGVFVV